MQAEHWRWDRKPTQARFCADTIQNRALPALKERQGNCSYPIPSELSFSSPTDQDQDPLMGDKAKKAACILDPALSRRQNTVTREVTEILRKLSLWGSGAQNPPETEAEIGELKV